MLQQHFPHRRRPIRRRKTSPPPPPQRSPTANHDPADDYQNADKTDASAVAADQDSQESSVYSVSRSQSLEDLAGGDGSDDGNGEDDEVAGKASDEHPLHEVLSLILTDDVPFTSRPECQRRDVARAAAEVVSRSCGGEPAALLVAVMGQLGVSVEDLQRRMDVELRENFGSQDLGGGEAEDDDDEEEETQMPCQQQHQGTPKRPSEARAEEAPMRKRQRNASGDPAEVKPRKQDLHRVRRNILVDPTGSEVGREVDESPDKRATDRQSEDEDEESQDRGDRGGGQEQEEDELPDLVDPDEHDQGDQEELPDLTDRDSDGGDESDLSLSVIPRDGDDFTEVAGISAAECTWGTFGDTQAAIGVVVGEQDDDECPPTAPPSPAGRSTTSTVDLDEGGPVIVTKRELEEADMADLIPKLTLESSKKKKKKKKSRSGRYNVDDRVAIPGPSGVGNSRNGRADKASNPETAREVAPESPVCQNDHDEEGENVDPNKSKMATGKSLEELPFVEPLLQQLAREGEAAVSKQDLSDARTVILGSFLGHRVCHCGDGMHHGKLEDLSGEDSHGGEPESWPYFKVLIAVASKSWKKEVYLCDGCFRKLARLKAHPETALAELILQGLRKPGLSFPFVRYQGHGKGVFVMRQSRHVDALKDSHLYRPDASKQGKKTVVTMSLEGHKNFEINREYNVRFLVNSSKKAKGGAERTEVTFKVLSAKDKDPKPPPDNRHQSQLEGFFKRIEKK